VVAPDDQPLHVAGAPVITFVAPEVRVVPLQSDRGDSLTHALGDEQLAGLRVGFNQPAREARRPVALTPRRCPRRGLRREIEHDVDVVQGSGTNVEILGRATRVRDYAASTSGPPSRGAPRSTVRASGSAPGYLTKIVADGFDRALHPRLLCAATANEYRFPRCKPVSTCDVFGEANVRTEPACPATNVVTR
jgi:hypothetical protein